MLLERQRLSVLVLSGSSKGADLISNLLPSNAFFPIISVSNTGEARRLMSVQKFDIIVINTPLSDEFGTDFALDVSENESAGILMLVKSDSYEQVCYEVEDYGVLCLAKPNSSAAIYQAIKLLAATRARLLRAEKKTESLQQKMEEIRIVSRAKLMLIDHLRMSEENAHRYIEKKAMDMRISRREVAENILKTYEN